MTLGVIHTELQNFEKYSQILVVPQSMVHLSMNKWVLSPVTTSTVELITRYEAIVLNDTGPTSVILSL
jgi:hypothetical protein